MIVGIPKETKADERRVSLLPVAVSALVEAGHTVHIEQGAGDGAGVPIEEYIEAGAHVADAAAAVYEASDMIVKVKEPQPPELEMIEAEQIVFTFCHFAADVELTRAFTDTGAIAIAFETVQDRHGRLPILTPMSEIAGRMSVQEGAKYLESPQGGRGVLLGGLAGVAPADVVIIGAGFVGYNAALIAAGMGASVHLLDIDVEQLRRAETTLPANVSTYMSNAYNIEKLVLGADLLIGAVLLPGAKAPTLVSAEMVRAMKRGSVIVDAAIDQGGCVETMKATTHSAPTFVIDDVVHCGIANLPGGVPRTSTMALSNATYPYAAALANEGWEGACQRDAGLARGLNIVRGKVTHRGVSAAADVPFHPLPFETRDD